MNKVYLKADGRLFINDCEIEDVKSVSVKTDWMGSTIFVELKGDYKSDYTSEIKEHSLNECSKE